MPKLSETRLAQMAEARGVAPGFVPKAERKRKKPDYTESRDQQAVFAWWNSVGHIRHKINVRLLKAFPFQGVRTKRTGGRMKKEGCRAGTLDYTLSVARGPFNSLWIEQKTATGVLSDFQKEECVALISEQNCVVVCRSTQEAISQIEAYLSL